MSPTPFLAAGQMDRQIVLKTGVKSQSPVTNAEEIDWDSNDELIWAQWLPAGTREAWQAQERLETYVDGVFRIWYRTPPPTPDDTRIVFDGREFDVKPYVEIGRKQALEIPVVGR